MTDQKKHDTPMSKADVQRARGKEPDGMPSVGRLTSDGKTKDNEKLRIRIPTIEYEYMQVVVGGTSELITHAWDSKSIRQMLYEQLNPGRTKKQKAASRTAKDPFKEFYASIYNDENGDIVFRSNAFKKACISTCRNIPDVTMASIYSALTIEHEFSPLLGWPMCRLDTVKLNSGKANEVADIRFRGGFREWAIVLDVKFIKNIISASDVINLLTWAGASIGVGEWRQEKGGNSGAFRVLSSDEAEDVTSRLKQHNKGELTPENTGVHEILDRLNLLREAA